MAIIFVWAAQFFVLAFSQDQPTRLLVAPQLAVGWEGTSKQIGSYKWLTDVKITGNSFAKGSPVLFKFQKADGSPMIVDLIWSDGRREANVSESKFTPGPKISGSATIAPCSSCGSQSLKTGAIVFPMPISWSTGAYDYENDATVEVEFRRIDWQGNEVAAAGVDVRPFMSKFQVQARLTDRIDVGLAVYNPNSAPVKATFLLFNAFRKSGNPSTALATAHVDLKANEQKAFFFSQLFAGLSPDSYGNLATEGHVEASVDLPIAVTALKTYTPADGFLIAGIPVLQLK